MTGAAFSLRLTRAAATRDSEDERYARGREVLEQVVGPRGVTVTEALAATAPALVHHVVAYGFGEVYRQPELGPAQRQLVTIGALVALGGCERQLEVHVRAALNVGLSPAEIVAAVTHAALYCGFPRALNAMTVVQDVLTAHDPTPNNPPPEQPS